MKVEDLYVVFFILSVCYDITNLYMCHGGHGRKWCGVEYKPGAESERGI
jgi:hypothetical protein